MSKFNDFKLVRPKAFLNKGSWSVSTMWYKFEWNLVNKFKLDGRKKLIF